MRHESRDDYEIQNFWNKDLGLPFEPKEGRITMEALKAARSIDIGWTQQPGYVGRRAGDDGRRRCDDARVERADLGASR
jgi:hypothetical protein